MKFPFAALLGSLFGPSLESDTGSPMSRAGLIAEAERKPYIWGSRSSSSAVKGYRAQRTVAKRRRKAIASKVARRRNWSLKAQERSSAHRCLNRVCRGTDEFPVSAQAVSAIVRF